jgi:hypothetical protein
MPLETGTYISDLNASNPDGATDTKATLDNHIRLIKSLLLATFPNITGAVTPTHTTLNKVFDGLRPDGAAQCSHLVCASGAKRQLWQVRHHGRLHGELGRCSGAGYCPLGPHGEHHSCRSRSGNADRHHQRHVFADLHRCGDLG